MKITKRKTIMSRTTGSVTCPHSIPALQYDAEGHPVAPPGYRLLGSEEALRSGDLVATAIMGGNTGWTLVVDVGRQYKRRGQDIVARRAP